jgi:transcription initiation factor TFIID subunit 7
VNPDLSDSEFINQDATMDPATSGFGGSEAGDMPTPGGDLGDGDGEREEGDEGEEGEGDIDEDLAAELDLALGDEEEGAEGDEEDDEDDESEEEDEDDDDDEAVQAKKLLNEEIRDLEAAVAKKNNEIASSANPLIRVSCIVIKYWKLKLIDLQRRFEDALRKLQSDLDTKLVQRDEMKEKQRWQKEGAVDSAPGSEGGDTDSDESEGDDLFGDSNNMNIG